MQREQLSEAERLLLKNHHRRIWQKIVSVMACLVVFCTTYALILPAITQENAVTCGFTEHTHSESCYTQIMGEPVVQLTCSLESLGIHTHSEACLDADGNRICGLTDYIVHTHDASCLDEAGNLICTLPERVQHVHSDSCYESLEPEIHSHADSCYTLEQGELICELPESEEHTHTSACYAQIRTVACGIEEGAVIEAKPVLICTEPAAPVHVHLETCFATIETESTRELTCALEEHAHSLVCYADLTADVETVEDWEESFANVVRSGVWTEDILAIAKTQLGYQESTRNYIVLEDGETTKGYTRYGAWYGDPYGDWCAIFTSFCLHYAGVEEMPLDSNCPNWIVKLTEAGLYQANGSYVPEAGDLIFFDWDADGDSDHVGFVNQLSSDEETGVLQISTIEGNSANRVQSKTYAMDDATILGYGTLPVQLTEEEQLQVERVIAMIDAMPSADEIDAKLAEFEEAEDYEGEEAWYTEVSQQVAEAYYYYDQLTDALKSKVTNADKLLELEYIWSVTALIENINSAAPTTTWYTSTKDFIELNLYDYNSGINDKWISNKKYPGFQWNGGAYAKSDYKDTNASADAGIPNNITDRNFVDSIDFGNSKITDYDYDGSDYAKSSTAVGVGYLYSNSDAHKTGKINWLWYNGSDYGTTTNRPVGYSTGYGSLLRTLKDGYPALSDGTSLAYLFQSGDAVTKKNTETIDGLFQQDSVTGEYNYNSRINHAQYTNNFFQLYDQIITPNFILYPFGNFLPLNSISDLTEATQVGAFNYSGGVQDYVEAIMVDLNSNDKTDAQLKVMLQEYKENWTIYPRTINGTSNSWTNLSAANAIRDFFWKDNSNNGDGPTDETDFITPEHLNNMYNIDWDVDTNFFFGMEMKMTFMQPKGGYTGNDTNKDGASDYPMEFYFTGDDDVWVYIDDVLFLDLSGIHRHVGGGIDFVNGKVHYYELDVENGGDVSTTPYKTYTFAELLTEAGKSTDGLNEKGTFADYSTHTFNFYYMERGSGSSVCRMNFNFPLLHKNSITVTKENATLDGGNLDDAIVGNPDYYFNIVTPDNELFVGPNSVTGITKYKIVDGDGNVLKNADGTDKEFTVDQYGIFTIKAGQSAVFEGIEENEGKYFVQELIKEEDNAQYPDVYINDQESRYNKLIDWSYRKYFTDNDSDNETGPYGYRWFGRSGYETDVSSNHSFYFEQQNRLEVTKLGKLSITKVLESEDQDKTFDMEVTLDGEKLPVGTKYTVGSAEKTVETEGIITLTPGETAILSNIISGSEFTVRETNGGSYTVTYKVENADEVKDNGSSVTGVVRTGTTVAVTVTNTEQGAAVEIPVTKKFSTDGSTDAAHKYTFELQQVTNNTGNELVTGGTSLNQTVEFTGNLAKTNFTMSYLNHQIETLPAVFYYLIVENGEENDSLDNKQTFVAEVTVSERTDGTEGITAAVTGMWENGVENEAKSADFMNTLIGDLSLEKIVAGSTESQTTEEFSFTITLEPGTSGLTALPDTFAATFYQQNGEVQETQLKRSADGTIKLTGFKHDETAVIHGIPIGTHWAIAETGAEGYVVTATVNGSAANMGTGAETTGSIVAGSTEVVYTNTQMYELPETGGAGTTLYTMAGLMLCSMAFLLYRYQKRRKEVQ